MGNKADYVSSLEGLIKNTIPKYKSHGWDHVRRVTDMCMQIGEAENANTEVLTLAALLHDVSRLEGDMKDHVKKSATRAEYYLEEISYPEDKREMISRIIAEHSLDEIIVAAASGKTSIQSAIALIRERKFSSKEAEILYDSDKIDFLGAAGIYRTISRWIEENWDVDILPQMYYTTAHIIFDTLHSKTAKSIAKPKLILTFKFCQELGQDLGVRIHEIS
jgi:uncharacterized protein